MWTWTWTWNSFCFDSSNKKQFHNSYKTSKSILWCIGNFEENMDLSRTHLAVPKRNIKNIRIFQKVFPEVGWCSPNHAQKNCAESIYKRQKSWTKTLSCGWIRLYVPKSKTNAYCFKLKYKEWKRLVVWAVPKEITLHFSCSFTWIQLKKKSWFFFRVTSCIVTCSWLFFLLLKLIPYGLGMGSFWVLSHLRSINYAKFFNIIISSV